MSPAIKHVLVALGVGVLAACALIPATGEINWRSAAVAGVQAFLTAMGVGAYVRKASA